MDINIILGITGLVLSVISLLYAIYITKKSKLEKNLIYEVMPAVGIADVLKGQSAYSLQVVYERPGESPIYIPQAVTHCIRFTNFGKIPIERKDLVEADPVRIELTGGRILDVSAIGVTREVCSITVSRSIADDNVTTAKIDFAFLDHLDGGLIQVLSDSKDTNAVLLGTVIGMPDGIRMAKEEGKDSNFLIAYSILAWIIVEILSLASTPFIYRYIMGTWDKVWIVALPIVAVIWPVVLWILFLIIFTPRDKFTFPEKLIPPNWYHKRTILPYYESLDSSESQNDTTKIEQQKQ